MINEVRQCHNPAVITVITACGFSLHHSNIPIPSPSVFGILLLFYHQSRDHSSSYCQSWKSSISHHRKANRIDKQLGTHPKLPASWLPSPVLPTTSPWNSQQIKKEIISFSKVEVRVRAQWHTVYDLMLFVCRAMNNKPFLWGIFKSWWLCSLMIIKLVISHVHTFYCNDIARQKELNYVLWISR